MSEQLPQEKPEQSNHAEHGTAQPAVVPRTAPYEIPLTKAFDKLTSEVFLFLLAYLILLIGLAVFGSNLVATLRDLFYILPVLGVIAYLWQQQRTIVKDGKDRGIDVKAGKITDQARVGGVVNAPRDRNVPNAIRVRIHRAQDSARISGIEYGDGDELNDETSYIARVFRELSQQNQKNLIESAHRMLTQQEQSHG